MHEARIEDTGTGRLPADDGWFILNVADIGWETVPGGGSWCGFESPASRSEMLGIGVHVLRPGERPGLYHHESDQEGFLVLSGECLAIVEGEERRMGPWDYLHCPPGTAHITIGAGDGPCAILMVGTRTPGHTTHYPADPVAARHGAAVPVATDSPREAYRDRPPITRAPAPWPPRIRFDHAVIHVSDWARSNAFYAEVLGAQLIGDPDGPCRYRFGDQQLNVHGPGLDAHPLARVPVQPGNSDLCFLWDGPVEAAVAHLREHGVEIEEGPVDRVGARGDGTSVYFRDPDGSLLELIAYPRPSVP